MGPALAFEKEETLSLARETVTFRATRGASDELLNAFNRLADTVLPPTKDGALGVVVELESNDEDTTSTTGGGEEAPSSRRQPEPPSRFYAWLDRGLCCFSPGRLFGGAFVGLVTLRWTFSMMLWSIFCYIVLFCSKTSFLDPQDSSLRSNISSNVRSI